MRYGLPLVVTTSGGKDSSVCVALAERAGIPDTRLGVTLTAVLSLLQPHENVFIMHRISRHELEAIGGGTVRELQAIQCAETCGSHRVERWN